MKGTRWARGPAYPDHARPNIDKEVAMHFATIIVREDMCPLKDGIECCEDREDLSLCECAERLYNEVWTKLEGQS